MTIHAARLMQLIDARDYEAVARVLPAASAADLAAIPTLELVRFLSSLSDLGRRTIPDSFMQELRRRRPSTSEMAIFLAGELVLAGLAEDAGLVMRDALDATPNKGLCLWSWIGHLVGMGRLAEARAELAAASRRYPDLLAAEAAAVDIDMAERKFDAAASRLEKMGQRTAKLGVGVQWRIDRAKTYASLAQRFAAARPGPGAAPDYAAYAINLDDHADRFRNLQAQFAAERPALIRIPGVRGRYMPDAAAARLGGPTAAAAKGTLGCFLSHVAAWERFRGGGFAHGLFVEDDARLAVDLPPTVAALGLPPGYDLCFASVGMEPNPPPAPTMALHFQTVAAVVAAKAAAWNAPGGYGYFLSRPGVEKLLRLIARDGFAGDVDWRLVAYSLGKAECARMAPDREASARLRRQQEVIEADEPIAAWCLHPALFLPGRIGSLRKADNLENMGSVEPAR